MFDDLEGDDRAQGRVRPARERRQGVLLLDQKPGGAARAGCDRVALHARGGDPALAQQAQELSSAAARVQNGTGKPLEKRQVELLPVGDLFRAPPEPLLEEAVDAGREGRDSGGRRRRPGRALACFQDRQSPVLDRGRPAGGGRAVG